MPDIPVRAATREGIEWRTGCTKSHETADSNGIDFELHVPRPDDSACVFFRVSLFFALDPPRPVFRETPCHVELLYARSLPWHAIIRGRDLGSYQGRHVLVWARTTGHSTLWRTPEYRANVQVQIPSGTPCCGLVAGHTWYAPSSLPLCNAQRKALRTYPGCMGLMSTTMKRRA